MFSHYEEASFKLNSIYPLYFEADYSNMREFHLYDVNGHHAMLEIFSKIPVGKLPQFFMPFAHPRRLPSVAFPIFRFCAQGIYRSNPGRSHDSSCEFMFSTMRPLDQDTAVSSASFFDHPSSMDNPHQQASHGSFRNFYK